MPTYLIEKEIPIRRQEGDTADIVFTVPEIINMANYSCKLAVKSTSGTSLILKDSTDGGAAIQGQVVSVQLGSNDTKRKAGTHRWELELYNNDEVITIGRGVFEIVAEMIR